jgi:hypothetical protein
MISIAGNALLSKEQSFRFSSCFSRHFGQAVGAGSGSVSEGPMGALQPSGRLFHRGCQIASNNVVAAICPVLFKWRELSFLTTPSSCLNSSIATSVSGSCRHRGGGASCRLTINPVAVEKPPLLKKPPQPGDGKCPPKSRTSFIGHPGAVKFLRISRV